MAAIIMIHKMWALDEPASHPYCLFMLNYSLKMKINHSIINDFHLIDFISSRFYLWYSLIHLRRVICVFFRF